MPSKSATMMTLLGVTATSASTYYGSFENSGDYTGTSGFAEATLNDDCLTVTVDYEAPAPGVAYVHLHLDQGAAQPKFAFTASNTGARGEDSRTTTTVCDLSDSVIDQLNDGKVYANIHTGTESATGSYPGIAKAFLAKAPTFKGSFNNKAKGSASAKLIGNSLEVNVDYELKDDATGYLHLHINKGTKVVDGKTVPNEPKFAWLGSNVAADESATFSRVDNLSQDVIDELKAGNVFVNIHSNDAAGTSIGRAYLSVSDDVEDAEELKGKKKAFSGNFVDSGDYTGSSGSATATLQGDCLSVSIDYKTESNVDPAKGAGVKYIHFHRNIDGQPKFGFQASNTGEAGYMSATSSTVCDLSKDIKNDLKAGLVYVNLHEPDGKGIAKAFLTEDKNTIEYAGDFDRAASGKVAAVFNEDTKCLDVDVDYTIDGESPFTTGYLHLHWVRGEEDEPKFAYAGSNNQAPFKMTESSSHVCQLNDEEIAALKAGKVYVNLHTGTASGETAVGGGVSRAFLNFAGDSLRGDFNNLGSGSASAVIKKDCLEVSFDYDIGSLATRDVHLHYVRGVEDEPKFAYLASNVGASASQTSSRVCDLSDEILGYVRSGLVYVNVHTADAGVSRAVLQGSCENDKLQSNKGAKFEGEFDRGADGKAKAYWKDGCLDVKVDYEIDQRVTDYIHLHYKARNDQGELTGSEPKFAFLASTYKTEEEKTFSRVCDFSADVVAALKNGDVYVNLHSPATADSAAAGISKAPLIFQASTDEAKFEFSKSVATAQEIEDAIAAKYGDVDYEVTKIRTKGDTVKVYVKFSFETVDSVETFSSIEQSLTVNGVTAKAVTFSWADESIDAGMSVGPSFLAVAALALAFN